MLKENNEILMSPVASTNIKEIGYDDVKKELHVAFKKSGVYIYEGVEKKLYDDFLIAESKGKFFNTNVRVITKFRKK